MGRRVGSPGRDLTPERRLEIARAAAAARWSGRLAARAPRATAKEALAGWALVSLALAAVGALAALAVRVF
jgi:hypothetical protein